MRLTVWPANDPFPLSFDFFFFPPNHPELSGDDPVPCRSGMTYGEADGAVLSDLRRERRRQSRMRWK